MPDQYKKHPLLNPTGDYNGKLSLDNDDPESQKSWEHIKDTIGPSDFIRLISGQFGHIAVSNADELASKFEGHRHNIPRNTDAALRYLAEHDPDEIKWFLKHFNISPEKINDIIEDPRKYGFNAN
jgi:hypothetical protein